MDYKCDAISIKPFPNHCHVLKIPRRSKEFYFRIEIRLIEMNREPKNDCSIAIEKSLE